MITAHGNFVQGGTNWGWHNVRPKSRDFAHHSPVNEPCLHACRGRYSGLAAEVHGNYTSLDGGQAFGWGIQEVHVV